MSKLSTIGKLALEILQRVPEPHVAAAAAAIEGIVAAVHQAHMDAPPEGVTLAELQQQVRDAAAAAREPWERIHQRATAAQLGSHTGSTGE